MEKFIPTGNEFISLPCIKEVDGSIDDLTFLLMQRKGMVELQGDWGTPLCKPYVRISGQEKVLTNRMVWSSIEHWIPKFIATCSNVEVTGMIICPNNERGFEYHLEVKNLTDQPMDLEFGFWGGLREVNHVINCSKKIRKGTKSIYNSGWNPDGFIIEMMNDFPLFAVATLSKNADKTFDTDNFNWRMSKRLILGANETTSMDFYYGVGYEETAAATSAKQLYRLGHERILSQTCEFLRERHIEGLGALSDVFHRNLFFNYFYACGITLDTEHLIMCTSRGTRYYVSSAYWDRDCLLWSYPSILLVDEKMARECLKYVFRRQMKNVGVHSRFIDGVVLEPGFELDELCAPVIALRKYIEKTKDFDFLKKEYVRKGIEDIIEQIEEHFNHKINLVDTFLQPTDDEIVHPYLTYNNALVIKALKDILWLYPNRFGDEILKTYIEDIINGIKERCIKTYKGKRIFAWSVNENDEWNVYDEPPGSLLLLPYYEFCSCDDEVYKNTCDVILDKDYELSFADKRFGTIGCLHATHPWLLSVANNLIARRDTEKMEYILANAPLDNGFACESFDENTGECTTGSAFATCAGFVAYSIYHYKKLKPNKDGLKFNK
ncbi:MAG: glycoside hydrolase family 125 protein [Clostridia bacterium]|nr:glycoside hydrolase family 125 protein [Clostridia bacterium]